MIGQGWHACTEPKAMLEFLRGKASDRKLRLFACACCRLVWPLLIDERSRRAVEAAECFADGVLADSDAQEAFSAACAASLAVRHDSDDSSETVLRLRRHHHPYKVWRAGAMAAFAVGTGAGDVQAHIRGQEGHLVDGHMQCQFLRDIFGPARFDAAWLTPTVVNLARTIYDERIFDRMPSLADALAAAGCVDQDILAHCRGPGPHVRGCCVVDLLLGKE